MNRLFIVVFTLAVAGGSTLLTTSCASRGTAEDFTWLMEWPKTVEPGSEFSFAVRTVDPAGQAVKGVKYRYQIQWPGGTSNPYRHSAASGASVKLRARRDTGPATLVILCENRRGQESKVLEAAFEVK